LHLVDAAGNWWDLDDEIPDYVRASLCAWAKLRCRSSRATPHVPETEQLAIDPSYDPEADWLDEPFPEEYE